MIIRYSRTKRGVRTGVFVAKMVDGKAVIGWSKCHRSLDRFDKKEGIRLATERIDKGIDRRGMVPAEPIFVPHSMRDTLVPMVEACKKYFNTDQVFLANTPVGVPKNSTMDAWDIVSAWVRDNGSSDSEYYLNEVDPLPISQETHSVNGSLGCSPCGCQGDLSKCGKAEQFVHDDETNQ